MERYGYDAAARIIKIEDITTDKIDRKILRKLKENDPGFGRLWVSQINTYCPNGARDLGWLVYYIGPNTNLRELNLNNMHLSGGEIFQSLRSFLENNDNVSKLEVKECHFGVGCARQLS